MTFLEFFTDPLLRGPMLGAIFICMSTSVISVFVYVQKRTLVGETLSHATYPGVLLAALFTLLFGGTEPASFVVVPCAFVAAFFGLWLINRITRKSAATNDSALTFVLASFFAVGITLASVIQAVAPATFQKIRLFFYGQTASLGDLQIISYALFLLSIVLVVSLFFKEFKLLLFDRAFTRLTTPYFALFDSLILCLIVFSVVLAMKSVGVILVSGMLIGPAVAARQYTHSLVKMFILSALFGAFSAFFGNILSLYLSDRFLISLPTGPTIVIIAQSIALFSLFFAPKRGVFFRKVRVALFRFKSMQENLLKFLWAQKAAQPFSALSSRLGISALFLRIILWDLSRKAWVTFDQGYLLTQEGKKRGGHIVRLHRLWELYLVKDFHVSADKVHKSAEQIEHILTPELEKELTQFLHNPLSDPHNQPIPSRAEVSYAE